LSAVPDMPSEPDLSPTEAAHLSGVSYWTVLRQIHDGKLRAFRRPGNQLAIRHDDFLTWAYGQPVEPRSADVAPEPPPRRSRGRGGRGSLASLEEIERRRGAT
jgi:excisionase family DNA binding protein